MLNCMRVIKYFILIFISLILCSCSQKFRHSNPYANWNSDYARCNAFAQGHTPMPQIQSYSGYQTYSGYGTINGTPYSYYGSSYNPMQDFSTSMNNLGSSL